MKARLLLVALLVWPAVLVTTWLLGPGQCQERYAIDNGPGKGAQMPEQHALQMIKEGRQTFRLDTFGDEAFWGDALKLHQAIAGKERGGVGTGMSPKMALDVGLRVDTEALPANIVQQLRQKQIDLNDPAVTLTLLQHDAVVGVRGIFQGKSLQSIGITCAICHSTVDNSFAPGMGRRLDGWANRDLDIGKIITLAPNLQPLTERLNITEDQLQKALLSWGPGKFDAELLHDGKAFRPDGKTAATLLPPAFGQAGISLHTREGWGSVAHWNAYVAVTQMRGKGTFFDPRLKDADRFPVAAKLGEWNIRHDPDLVHAASGRLYPSNE